MQTLLRILIAVFFPLTVTACIWDSDSLAREKSRSHDLAQVILDKQPPPPDETKQLQARIVELEANRKDNDPDWWNNLAGAYLRLNQPEKAAILLEPIVVKFSTNYGIHANLGTAYHLMGRYADAEKEIARDLEINPDAHFGLEKYHLALLQYLIREPNYQRRHVYVDEFTGAFLTNDRGWGFDGRFNVNEDMLESRAAEYHSNVVAAEQAFQSFQSTNKNEREILEMLGTVAKVDPPPAYRDKWNLARESDYEAGTIYMVQMNPKEPACWTMLGIVAWQKHNYHLAISAFGTSIQLGSLQSELLGQKIGHLEEFIRHSERQQRNLHLFLAVIVVLPCLAVCAIVQFIRRKRT